MAPKWERRVYIKELAGLQMVWRLFFIFCDTLVTCGFTGRRGGLKTGLQAPAATVRMQLATAM